MAGIGRVIWLCCWLRSCAELRGYAMIKRAGLTGPSTYRSLDRLEDERPEPLRAAARRRRPRRPRLVASPQDARTGRAPGWYAGALRGLVRWPGPPVGPVGAPPESGVFPQVFQSQVAGPAARGLARGQPRDGSLAGVAPVGDQDRRWLGRELHDGLGPALAGLMLGLGTAQALSAGQPDLQYLLGRLALETQRAVTDLRRIVYGLRPSVLDELGLAGSLREEVERLRCAVPALAVSLDVPGDGLVGLPAVVEEACYRIVTEALANVARHARATRCAVRIHFDRGLRIDVRDNGVGLPGGWRAGAGIASMRERACELGGQLVIVPCLPQGTRIAARLPAGVQP
jgi:Histidine kinase/Histidine kinase-, DNA gyrase B-, and HSP90-like ATPase